jgi:hypothetical protein
MRHHAQFTECTTPKLFFSEVPAGRSAGRLRAKFFIEPLFSDKVWHYTGWQAMGLGRVRVHSVNPVSSTTTP